MAVMHDNRSRFTSDIFRHFLEHDHIKDKRILNSYSQLQMKIEPYSKIVKNEFLSLEDIPNMDDSSRIYHMFIRAYNEDRVT